jgi:hypothetical protein
MLEGGAARIVPPPFGGRASKASDDSWPIYPLAGRIPGHPSNRDRGPGLARLPPPPGPRFASGAVNAVRPGRVTKIL